MRSNGQYHPNVFYVLLVTILLIFPMFFMTTDVVAPPPEITEWMTSTISSDGDVGMSSSLALDSLDQVHISYYDYTNGDLKYITNAGDMWYITTVDSVGTVGLATSLALDSANKAHISYFDLTNGDLKYATNIGGLWDTTTIDSAGDVGPYTSIAVDSTDKVHISYYDGTNANLKYATNADGFWSTTTVDSIGDVGAHCSIAVDSWGKAHISYLDATNFDLKYATNAGGPWDISTVDNGYVGTYSSIALDSTNKVHVSYSDDSNIDLKYATNAGGSWSMFTVDSNGYVGSYSSIAIDSVDRPHISYFDANDFDLKYAIYAGSWYTTTVDDDIHVGWFTSIDVDSADMAHISYYDASDNDLKYAAEVSVPSVPRSLKATAGDEFVDLSWTTPLYTGPGTLTYHLFRDGAEIWNGYEISHRDLQMTNDIEYSYAVVAQNSVGWGLNSTAVKATPSGGTTPAIPSAPTGLMATAGDTYVQLEWNVPSSPGSLTIVYHLFRDGVMIWSGMALSYNDTGVVNGVTYTYSVAAQNNAGWGPNSTSVTAMPIAGLTVPGVPLGLHAEAGNGLITLTWSAPNQSDGITIDSYIIDRGTSSGALTSIAMVTGTTYVDGGLTNGQTYYYKVSAVNRGGESVQTPEVVATPTSASTSNIGSDGDVVIILIIVALVAVIGVIAILLYMLRRRRLS